MILKKYFQLIKLSFSLENVSRHRNTERRSPFPGTSTSSDSTLAAICRENHHMTLGSYSFFPPDKELCYY